MNKVYNLRIGDMLWVTEEPGSGEVSNIVGLVYKMTPKYVYYAVCARRRGESEGDHFITKDHKVLKEKLYKSIKNNQIGISYANGTIRRRTISNAEDDSSRICC